MFNVMLRREPYCNETYLMHFHLGGVVVSVLGTGPKGHRFEHGQGDGFLSAIKISSTPSFGWEVKLEVPCCKILRHVKDLLKSHRDGVNSHFLNPSSYLLQRCLC
jgi:hypothetical protein